jgi:hypothetical protein
MDTRLIVGLVAGVLLLGLYYVESIDNQPGPLPAEYTQGPEARKWLRANESESALASNRFGETRDALQFVQQLYNAGAVRVIVPQTAIRKDDVETYADALVVTLPSDPAKRERVWKLCAQELRREGEKPGDSTTESHVLLWWD